MRPVASRDRSHHPAAALLPGRGRIVKNEERISLRARNGLRDRVERRHQIGRMRVEKHRHVARREASDLLQHARHFVRVVMRET